MSIDTLLAGVHFPDDMPAFDIGWRSLAVNLSDLAAMGATPRWCLLSLALPAVDDAWLAGFRDGFYALAEQSGITLVGGDTVRGPLAVTVQVTGEVPEGLALTRAGASAGERLCISGVPGEAAAGLALWQGGARGGPLVGALARPAAPVRLGESLRGLASACIDISDGLLPDLGHLLAASGLSGADIQLAQLPLSEALGQWGDDDQRRRAQLVGGDDYLLLFTLPDTALLPPECSVIGRVTNDAGVRLLDADGHEWPLPSGGYDHFAGDH
jgi:thiamine-monophosphate kinase